MNPEYQHAKYLNHKEHAQKYAKEHYNGEGYGSRRLCQWRWAKISIATYGQFLTLLAMAGYQCEICGTKLTERSAHVDHNHKNGKVRGILCMKCNNALGKFGDTLEGLMRAVRFIEEN